MKQIFSLFVLILFCTISEPARAVSLHYNAYGAGMLLMSGEMVYDVCDNIFNIQTHAQTKGMLKFVLEAQSIFYSDIKIQKNQFITVKSYIEALTGNKHKKRVIELKDKPDFTDYQTALLQMMYLDKPQDKVFKVYDGKREMLLTFKYMGKHNLSEFSEAMYTGSTDYYTLTIDITKGKRKGWFFNRMGNKDNPPLHLYFASIDGIEPKIMVKGAFDTTLFGQIALYLTRISGRADK